MKIFSAWPKISNWCFLKYSNFADSKSRLGFFISFLDQKLHPCKEGLKRPKRTKVDPLCRAVTFDPWKIFNRSTWYSINFVWYSIDFDWYFKIRPTLIGLFDLLQFMINFPDQNIFLHKTQHNTTQKYLLWRSRVVLIGTNTP